MRQLYVISMTGFVLMTFALQATAGITVYKKGDQFVTIGGRIQIQYHSEDPSSGAKTDEIFFRRLRPYIEGSLYPNWIGKIQWDMGGSSGSNEIAVKDAYFQYTGFTNTKITIGNADFPFSRELLTSSKKQALVERTFVGDHNYGTPDKNLGVHLKGHLSGKLITWGASIASASIDPSDSKLDFDTPVNKNDDFNEGVMYGGRIDFHPFGLVEFSQGDFEGQKKLSLGVAAFKWENDGDNNSHVASVDNVTGYEVSAAARLYGWSIDAQYNKFDADAVNATLTSGIFVNGSTELENWAVEAGYMIVPKKVELVTGYQVQDADGYASEWERTSFGVNYYLHKHKMKLQFTYRQNENVDGVTGSDSDEVFVQAQYVF